MYVCMYVLCLRFLLPQAHLPISISSTAETLGLDTQLKPEPKSEFSVKAEVKREAARSTAAAAGGGGGDNGPGRSSRKAPPKRALVARVTPQGLAGGDVMQQLGFGGPEDLEAEAAGKGGMGEMGAEGEEGVGLSNQGKPAPLLLPVEERSGYGAAAAAVPPGWVCVVGAGEGRGGGQGEGFAGGSRQGER